MLWTIYIIAQILISVWFFLEGHLLWTAVDKCADEAPDLIFVKIIKLQQTAPRCYRDWRIILRARRQDDLQRIIVGDRFQLINQASVAGIAVRNPDPAMFEVVNELFIRKRRVINPPVGRRRVMLTRSRRVGVIRLMLGPAINVVSSQFRHCSARFVFLLLARPEHQSINDSGNYC